MADNPNLMSAFGNIIPEIFSQEIELKTAELGFTRFRDFCVVKEDLTKNPGDLIHIPKLAELRTSQSLTESSVLRGSGQRIAVATLDLTPSEVGDELQLSQYSQITSPTDLVELAKDLLARQALKTENYKVRDVMFGASANRRYAAGVANRASVAADLDADDIDYVVEHLEDNEALKFPGESFIGFIHPFGRGAIRKDLTSIAAYRGTIGADLYVGEIGMYNRTRFIESRYCPFQARATGDIENATGGVTIHTATDYAFGLNYGLKAEKTTFTYTVADDKWAWSGAVSGSRTLSLFTAGEDPNDPTKSAVSTGNATVTDAQQTTYDVYAEVKDEDGNITGYDLGVLAGAISGAGSDGTCDITVNVHTLTSVFGQRHIAWAILRNITLLGIESWDYGRVQGIAWNAFWDCDFLHKNYGYVIEALL